MADLDKQLPAVIDKQLPAVIKKTTTEVAKLEPKLEKVNNEIAEINGKSIGLAEISAIFKQTNVQSNILINQFNTMIGEIEQETEVIIDEKEEIDKAAKATVNWAGVFDVLASSLSYVEKAFDGIWTSLNSTMDYMDVYNSYADSFGKIAEEWSGDYQKYGYENAEAYADSFTNRMDDTIAKLTGIKFDDENLRMASAGVKNLGLNIQDVTKTATQLAGVSNAVGLTGESTLAASSAFAKLAGDLSSLYNQDYSSVSQEIQSGLEGQTDALRKYGIELSDATLQSYAYESGMQKTVSEMTEAEKMQLRMVAILDQSEQAWGNLASGINEPSNQIKLFKNSLCELEQLFGQLFMPAFEKIMPYVNGIAIAVKELLGSIAGIFGIEVEYSAQAPLDISAETEATGGTTFTMSDEGATTGSVLDMITKYETVWDEAYENMENKAQKFAETLVVAFAPVEQLFNDIKIGDWFAVGEDVSNIVSGIFNFFATGIASVDWKQIGENIGSFFAGIDWTNIFASVAETIWEGLKAAFELYVGMFETAPIETALFTAIAGLNITGLGSVFSDKLTGLIKPSVGGEVAGLIGGDKAVTGLLSFIPSAEILVATTALAGLAVGLGVVFSKNEEVRESFSNAIGALQEGLQPAMELFTNTILPGLSSAWNGLMEILSPFFTFMEEMFVSLWLDIINPALTMIGTEILPALTSVLETLWNSVLVPFGEFLGSVLAPVIQIISDSLSIVWEHVVVPLGDALINILGAAFVGLCDSLNYLIEPIEEVIEWLQSLWNDAFAPVINQLWENWLPIWEICGETIGGVIDGLGEAFSGFIGFLTGVFTKDWEQAWKGVSEIFLGIFNGFISIVEGVVNIIIQGLNTFIASFDGVATSIGEVIGIDIEIPQIALVELPRFEMGGFPEDGLFMANHGELVGQFSNGKTVVANNEQIVSGIKLGVREAVSEVLAPYLADIAQNTKETANKDFATYIGDKEIARASERGRRAMGLQLITEF